MATTGSACPLSATALLAAARRGLAEPFDAAAEAKLLVALDDLVAAGDDRPVQEAIARLENEDVRLAAELRATCEGVAGGLGYRMPGNGTILLGTLYCLPVLLHYAQRAPRNPRTRLAHAESLVQIRDLMVASQLVPADATIMLSRHLYLPSDLVATSFCGARQIAEAFIRCLGPVAGAHPDPQLLAPDGDGMPTESPASNALQLRYLLFMVLAQPSAAQPFAPVGLDAAAAASFADRTKIFAGHLGRLVLRELGLAPGIDDCEPLEAAPFFCGLRHGMHVYLEEQLRGSLQQVLTTQDLPAEAAVATIRWREQAPVPGIAISLFARLAAGPPPALLAELTMPVLFDASEEVSERVFDVLSSMGIDLVGLPVPG